MWQPSKPPLFPTILLSYYSVIALMSYRARSEFEVEVLEKFEEKLEESDDVSDEVVGVIEESLGRTTISHRGAAEEIAEAIVEERVDASD